MSMLFVLREMKIHAGTCREKKKESMDFVSFESKVVSEIKI